MPQKRKGALIKSEAQMITIQDSVMKFYFKIGAIKNSDESMKLHQFFSPHTVPQGMTKDEVRQCLAVFPLRDWQRNRWIGGSLISLALGRPMPDDFQVFGRKITRAEFALGMTKFKADIVALLASDISGIHAHSDNYTGQTIPEVMVAKLHGISEIASNSAKHFAENVRK